jgi:hypothetical protein
MYLKRVQTRLFEEGLEARIEAFQLGATQLALFIMERYGELTIYQGPSRDALAGYVYCYKEPV